MQTKLRYLLPTLLLLASCSGLLLRPGSDDTATTLPPGVRVIAGSIDSSTGCRLDYRVYVPDGPNAQALANGGAADHMDSQADDLVVLAHGFLRSQTQMKGLATSLAASGTRVATLDFCNASPWDGRHAQNGLDMVALARHLDARRVVYAGFSAGGLAAVIAGRADPKGIGIVTLDLVETQGLGVRAAKGLDKPLLALAGEPTNCNALDNGRAVFAATDWARVQRIKGAGHCDFESPTDGLCELVCTDPDAKLRTAAVDNGARPPEIAFGTSARERIIASTKLAVASLLDGDLLAWPHPSKGL